MGFGGLERFVSHFQDIAVGVLVTFVRGRSITSYVWISTIGERLALWANGRYQFQ